ncbi:hypothetical protein L5515_002416 [Caenorhabditis briggsae]|uniref:Uncharacterized protein n=1 Tax=Caenorhabditis briggsae TaxID=6238 RepID=A0AAE9E5E6_CAEBR|nr:hypothetical protein L5515_002416 [Caenorhabditis briggsae]
MEQVPPQTRSMRRFRKKPHERNFLELSGSAMVTAMVEARTKTKNEARHSSGSFLRIPVDFEFLKYLEFDLKQSKNPENPPKV